MSENTASRAETIYLDIFGVVAANIDYLEPEEGADLLPDLSLLETIASTIFGAAMAGLFAELSKDFFDSLRRRRFRKALLIENKPETLIAEMTQLLRTQRIDQRALPAAYENIERVLHELGTAEDIGRRIAAEILAALERHRDAG